MKVAILKEQNCINNINGKGNATTLPLLNTIKLKRNLIMSKSIYTPSKEEAIETFGRTLIEHEIPNPDELIEANVFMGDENGNYGNPTNYTHSKETRAQISKNNSRYWKGKTGNQHHATGSKRPDSVEIARKMGLANRGKTRNYKLVICPHCNKEGHSNSMPRWHFNNCRSK